jgi:hypothetical protein
MIGCNLSDCAWRILLLLGLTALIHPDGLSSQAPDSGHQPVSDASSLENIPTAKDPWAILGSDVSDFVTTDVGDLQGPEENDDPVDHETFGKFLANFSLLKLFGGWYLAWAIFVAGLLSLIFLLVLRRWWPHVRLKTVGLRRAMLLFFCLLLLYWSFVSWIRFLYLLSDPPFGYSFRSETIRILSSISPPLPGSLVVKSHEWLSNMLGLDGGPEYLSESNVKTSWLPWPLVLALGALLVAIGKYADDYMLNSADKSRIRDYLIRAFLYLEKPSIPEFEKPFIGTANWLWSRLRFWSLPALIVLSYWAFVTFVFFARQIIVGPPPKPYWRYLMTWALDSPMWLLYTLWALGTIMSSILCLAIFLRFAKAAQSMAGRLLLVLFGSVIAQAIVFNGYIGLLFFFGVGIPYGVFIPLGAIVISILPAWFITFSTLCLIITRAWVAGLRAVLLHIFDKASDPRVSPFIYATTLLSIILLGIKVISEL